MQKHHAERKPKWAYGGVYGLRSWCWRNPHWQPPKNRRRADPTAHLPSQPSPARALIKGPSWCLQSCDLGSGKSFFLDTKVSKGAYLLFYMIPLVSLTTTPVLCIFQFSIWLSKRTSCPWRMGVHFTQRQAGLAQYHIAELMSGGCNDTKPTCLLRPWDFSTSMCPVSTPRILIHTTEITFYHNMHTNFTWDGKKNSA